MRKIASVLAAFMLMAGTAYGADQNVLQWIDNAQNEDGQTILRKIIPNPAPPTTADQACQVDPSTFVILVNVGPNVTTFTDTAVQQNKTYCYELNAFNTAGVSPMSNIAGRTVPLTVPAQPSGLTVR